MSVRQRPTKRSKGSASRRGSATRRTTTGTELVTVEPEAAEEIAPQVVDTNAVGWLGDSPFFLVFEPLVKGPEGNIGIDIDTPGWIASNVERMRSPGTWILLRKPGIPMFAVVCHEGDQFYFTKRHTGILSNVAVENVTYGIGKKMADGTPVNIWLLPNGMVCGGDDVDILASRML